nr:chemosensory protein 13 [Pachyrhinus yasumatsui]
MHLLASVLIFGFLAVVLAGENGYSSRYDNVDIDKILNNDRVLSNYIKCLMEEGPCTPEGKELRKTLPDALANGCSKCSEKQKTTTEKVLKHLMNKKAREWNRLTKKYDPQGLYKQKYEQELTKKSA